MSRRVLIVEDEPSIVAALAFLLRQRGFETRTATDGEEALQLLGSFRPHLVVLDWMLPRRSGLEICGLIRTDPACAGTKVLMLTAKGGQGDVQRGMRAGADDYLTKPFATQELVGRVDALLGGPGAGERR